MYQFSSLSEIMYSKIISISIEDILNLSLSCGWIYEEKNMPILSKRGEELLQLQKKELFIELKRQMLMDYILKIKPIWAYRLPYGRREATIFMSKDEQACFLEAKLLSKQLNSTIIEWWDTISAQIRNQTLQAKNNIGRIGEENTIIYETIRTKSKPKWTAIESNLKGYDIESQLSKDEWGTLLIEVKTSTLTLNQAIFHITSYEWSIALTSKAYLFYIWCLFDGKKMLAILSPDDILPYIPSNNLNGEWESVKIPFSCFKNKFIEII